MPINIPDQLPAHDVLKQENAFVMGAIRAKTQDIRPLRIAILNLMPLKQQSELNLCRLLSNTPLQVEVDFITFEEFGSKNTAVSHMSSFYIDYSEMLKRRYDGLIITGAPVETMAFTDVYYWQQLQAVFEWSMTEVTSTLHICWGAQAGLFHHYGVEKKASSQKIHGVFEHQLHGKKNILMRGYDDVFWAPQSRWTYTLEQEIRQKTNLDIIACSESLQEKGVYLLASQDLKQVFVTGHPEYHRYALKEEYLRDKAINADTPLPVNYFEGDDDASDVILRWRSASSLLYSNWLNYAVYQETAYDLNTK